jgi:alpha-ribazole phosphatase
MASSFAVSRPRLLTVVRHAPPTLSGICYGQSDIPVSPSAAEAAEEVRRQLPAYVTHVYCSPSARTRTLATALTDRAKIPLYVDARLAEVDFGDWEGRAWNEIHRNSADALAYWAEMPLLRAPPRGESGRALIERLLDFVNRCDDGEHALLVCHSGPIRALRALATLPLPRRRAENVTSLDFELPVHPLVVETIPWDSPTPTNAP